MAKISSIYTLITADDKPLKRGLVSARNASMKGAKKIQAALNTINFKAVALGAAAMGVALGVAIKKFTDLASEQEAVEKRLAAVLKATGQAAGYNIDQLKDMASAMQQVTTTGDEVILSGQAILATFKQIRGEAFQRATMSALDLSEVIQQDLRSSIVMVGKALNDPIANLGALGRAGIQFTKDQKQVIKSLWESGRAAEAQNIILTEMESQFGGAAEAARDTFGGALKALGNDIGDIGEKIGFAMMPPLRIMIDKFSEWIKTNDRLLTQDIPGFITRIGDAAAKTYEVISRLDKAFDAAFGGKLTDTIENTYIKNLEKQTKHLELQKRRYEELGSEGKKTLDIINGRLERLNRLIKQAKLDRDLPSVIAGAFGDIDKAESLLPKTFKPSIGLAGNGKISEGGVAAKGIFGVPGYPENMADMWEKSFASIEENASETYDAMSAYEWQKFANHEKVAESMIKTDEKTSERMIKLTERTAWSMQQTFSDLFFDTMQGEFKSFEDYATGVLDSISRAISDMMAQWAVESLFGGLAKAGGGGGLFASLFHKGGIVGNTQSGRMVPASNFIGAPRLHNGLAANEFPAILQRGETVIPKDQSPVSISVPITINGGDFGSNLKYRLRSEIEQVTLNILQQEMR